MNNISNNIRNIKKRVLIVEDEKINRLILEKIIGDKYEVLYACNGIDAINVLKENKNVSLILLDLIMPLMDGLSFMKETKKYNLLKNIPIIVITSEKENEVECLNLGAYDFIKKPFEKGEVILARISRAIELYEDRKLLIATERDNLTNLVTKKYFFEYIKEFNKNNINKKMDAIVINVRKFHLVNELYGYDVGDELLIKISDILREILHNNIGIASRITDDNYYLYIARQSDYMTFLNDNLIKKIKIFKDNIKIDLRIGINVSDNNNIEDKFDKALLACNSLRNKSNEYLCYYDDLMHNKEIYNERLINDLDDAIINDEFKVYFQPKYNITYDKPRLCSAEALVRWNHKKLGLISPSLFIPLFEKEALIQKVDFYIWNKTAKFIKYCKDNLGIYVPISINVSRIDLLTPNFIEEINKIVEMNNISPNDLYLEITESAYTDNSKLVLDIINGLRKYGYKIEMDDFGTGYSSLNMVANLPIDIIKLDMSFIKNMHKFEKDKKMVEVVLEIAKILNVKVVAEGVEEEAQYKLLKEMNCDIIQGYYFSKPLDEDNFLRLIRGESNDFNK